MSTKGFTLLELSIVIVIIGLIVAGISAGQSLVRQAGLRSVLSDVSKYDTAIAAFYMQYGKLPGDLSTASSYWGAACDVTASNCDGNGDGSIIWGGGTVDNETLRAWQHLYLADLVSFAATGQTSTSNSFDIGVNIPEIGPSPNGITIHNWGAPLDANVYNIGGPVDSADASVPNHSATFTPAEVKSFDDKLDDGQPRAGKIWAASDGPGCWDSDTAYDLDDGGQVCWVHISLSL